MAADPDAVRQTSDAELTASEPLGVRRAMVAEEQRRKPGMALMKTHPLRLILRILAVTLLLTPGSPLALSQDAGRLRSQTAGSPGQEELAVREAEARWVEALDRRDGAALQALLDEDFVDVTWKGEVRDRRAAIAALNSPGRPSMTQTLAEVRVRFAVPDVAVVTGLNAVSSKAPEFTARIRFTDVFVKRGGAWRALSAQETLEK